jgi:hypothetical protein
MHYNRVQTSFLLEKPRISSQQQVNVNETNSALDAVPSCQARQTPARSRLQSSPGQYCMLEKSTAREEFDNNQEALLLGFRL